MVNFFCKYRESQHSPSELMLEADVTITDLLEALEMIVTSDIGWDSGEWESQCDDGRTPAEVAKAAIAKARNAT